MLVLVLPFTPADTGLPYAPLPTPLELGGLRARLVQDLRSDGERVVARGSSCTDAACARRAGRGLGADYVVFGNATRAMALIWSTAATLVEVRTGRPHAFEAGYKGDYDAMRLGIDELAVAVESALHAKDSR